jgi:hypothetical protein
MFHAERRPRIGNRGDRNFFFLNDNQASSYLPPQTYDWPVHKISSGSRPFAPNDNPGPGEYDPINLSSYRSTTLTAGDDRSGWTGITTNPAPGAYTPGKGSFPREPAYSIGRRSRRTQQQKPQIRFAVDVFLVTIQDPELDLEDANNYMNSHHELRAIPVEVIQAIFASKPIAPVGYLRDYFRLIRDSRLPGLYHSDPEGPAYRYYLW